MEPARWKGLLGAQLALLLERLCDLEPESVSLAQELEVVTQPRRQKAETVRRLRETAEDYAADRLLSPAIECYKQALEFEPSLNEVSLKARVPGGPPPGGGARLASRK